jgi:hypothetical protein
MTDSAVKKKTASERTMETKYRGMTRPRRMDEAVKLVLDGMSQSEAARRTGISRARLNQRIRDERAKLAEYERRSQAAIAERNRALVDPSEPAGPYEPVNEVRRVQPPDQFMRDYFSHVVCPDCGVSHPIPDFHDEMLGRIVDPGVRRLLVNLAPYHAKSTVGTVYSTLYELCRDPNSRTGIVSKSEKLAARFLYQISKFLADPNVYEGAPKNLIDDWGPFHAPSSWNKNEIYIAGRQGAEKDPSVSVYGVGAQIYGYRFDRMIFDDVADLENQRNPDRVAEMLKWATQECASRVGKSGKLVFLGTRVSSGDIYSYLEGLPAYEVMRYSCIQDEEAGSMLWGDHFPYRSAVEQRDSMGVAPFQLVYQNVDMPGEGSSFPLETLERCFDAGRVVGHYEPHWRLVIGLDPAGGGAQSGFTAMVLLGVDVQTGRRYLVDVMNQKAMKAPQVKDQILDWASRYPVSELRVEVNGLQGQIYQYDTELVQRLTQAGVRVAPHVTGGHNKWDPQFGVESMSPMFYNEQISVPHQDLSSRRRFQALVDQLQQFPMGKVTDCVMALWFADLAARDLILRANLPAFDGRMKIPNRVRRSRRIVDFGSHEVRKPEPGEIMDPLDMAPERRQYVNVAGGVNVY